MSIGKHVEKSDDTLFRDRLLKKLKLSAITSTQGIIEVVKEAVNESHETGWYTLNFDIVDVLGINNNNVIYVFGAVSTPAIEIRGKTISFIVQRNVISKDTIPYLQLLDVIILFRKVYRTHLEQVVFKYQNLIKNLSAEEKKLLVKLARKYTPFTRSTLAFILRSVNEVRLSVKLTETLNPEIIKKHKEKMLFLF